MKVFTIGFTKSSAESFFSRLKKAGVRKVIDVRLNNVSQLAGFAKRDDLRYFLRELCGADYEHMPFLAPTQEMLDAYKKQKGSWADYERQFLELLRRRRVEAAVHPDSYDGACLLCSEDKPTHCHRRLVAEYLQSKWPHGVDTVHL